MKDDMRPSGHHVARPAEEGDHLPRLSSLQCFAAYPDMPSLTHIYAVSNLSNVFRNALHAVTLSRKFSVARQDHWWEADVITTKSTMITVQ